MLCSYLFYVFTVIIKRKANYHRLLFPFFFFSFNQGYILFASQIYGAGVIHFVLWLGPLFRFFFFFWKKKVVSQLLCAHVLCVCGIFFFQIIKLIHVYTAPPPTHVFFILVIEWSNCIFSMAFKKKILFTQGKRLRCYVIFPLALREVVGL